MAVSSASNVSAESKPCTIHFCDPEIGSNAMKSPSASLDHTDHKHSATRTYANPRANDSAAIDATGLTTTGTGTDSKT